MKGKIEDMQFLAIIEGKFMFVEHTEVMGFRAIGELVQYIQKHQRDSNIKRVKIIDLEVKKEKLYKHVADLERHVYKDFQ